MNWEETLAKALMSGCLTLNNCQIAVGNNAQMGNLMQNPSASTQNQDNKMEMDPRLQSEKAKMMWRQLVDHKYIHAEGSWYVWDASQVEYGYMVYIVSQNLGLKNPSSSRLQWKSFHALFLNAQKIEKVAQVAVSNGISSCDNYKQWCKEAKFLKNILDV